MDFNLRCEDFKAEISKLITQSKLPMAIVYYILKDVYTQIQNTYFGTINSIRLQQQKEKIENLKKEIEKTKQVEVTQEVLKEE